MKYDDASWHSEGQFPEDLPPEAGATHTGMFLAWAFLSGLASETHLEDFPESLPLLVERSTTPGEFFLTTCDGKFTDEELNEEGNAFTVRYFDFDHGKYLEDYQKTLGPDLPSLYAIEDTWENFDRLKPVLDQRYAEWQETSA